MLMQYSHTEKHAPFGYAGILGCGGYQNTTNVICMAVANTGEFITEGIVEGTLLFIDTNTEYQSGSLNVFKYKAERNPQYKLSKKRIPKASYIGKVLMAINQYQ